MGLKRKFSTLVILLVLALVNFSSYSSSEALTYKVLPGDSLFKIAQKHGTTIQAIQTANNLKTSSLLAGQTLEIPPVNPKVANVTASKINFRSGPGTNYKILKSLPQGTQAAYLTSSKSWHQIRLTSGETGWVINWSVKLASGTIKTVPSVPSREITTEAGTVTTYLNLRTGPTTSAKVISVLPAGTKVQILQIQGAWLQVKTSTKGSGWVAAKYVAKGTVPLPSRGSQPVVPPVNPPSTPENPIQPPPSKTKNIMGFYVRDWPQDNASQNSLQNYGELITTIAAFEFSVDEHGNLLGTHDAQAMATAKQKNVKVLALVHNIFFGNSAKSKAVAKAVLTNSTVRAKTINGIYELMERYGYDGINIDIEYVAPADRSHYTNFIKELSEKLKPKGYAVTVSVPAKLKEDPNHGWSGGYDYPNLNKFADYFMIMAYDEHGFSSGPGPIASVGWNEQIINYAKSVLPPEKILLGIPTYGFDWTIGKGSPKYLSYQQAMKIAQDQKATILWDNVGKVPYFKYTQNGENHEVWFENAKSMEEKLMLMDKHNLAGIAIWRLGFEDPASWGAIKAMLNVQK